METTENFINEQEESVTKKSKDEAETPVEVNAASEEASVGPEVQATAAEAAPVGDAASENNKLVEELEAARAQVLEGKDQVLRMAAELDNFKKRTAREKEIALKYAEESLIKELLPSLDNLERAVEQGHSEENGAALLEGVEMTLKGLMTSLEKFGVKPVESVGQAFDPNFHEALGMEASEEMAPNTVIKEYQKGYFYKERLLRAAKVIVVGG